MKIRQGFVANSSSSSFMIVGKSVSTDQEAGEFAELFGKDGEYHYMEYENRYVTGIDIDPGIADSCEVIARKFLNTLELAIKRVEEAGVKSPKLYSDCTYNG